MIVGSRRAARASTTARYALLAAGAVLMVTPFAYLLATSFKAQAFVLEFPPRFIPKHPTRDNYRQAWSSNHFGRYFLNSVLVASATTVITTLISAMAAFAFTCYQFRMKRLLYGAFLLGLMVPGIMLIIPQFVLAKQLHLLDSLSGLVVFYVGTAVALSTFLLRGFMQRVPVDLDEAMVIDGAGSWRLFTSLYVPLSRPALATVSIFAFLGAWDEYVWAVTSINDPGKRTLPIAIALFQGQFRTSWGLVFAASVIAITPVIAVFIAAQRQFVQGLTTGAVKG